MLAGIIRHKSKCISIKTFACSEFRGGIYFPDRNELVSIVTRNVFIIFGVGCVHDYFVGMHSTNNFCILSWDAFGEYHTNCFCDGNDIQRFGFYDYNYFRIFI